MKFSRERKKIMFPLRFINLNISFFLGLLLVLMFAVEFAYKFSFFSTCVDSSFFSFALLEFCVCVCISSCEHCEYFCIETQIVQCSFCCSHFAEKRTRIMHRHFCLTTLDGNYHTIQRSHSTEDGFLLNMLLFHQILLINFQRMKFEVERA